jgi:hypothetical protein
LIWFQERAVSDPLTNVSRDEGPVPNHTKRYVELSLPVVRVHRVAAAALHPV